MLQVILFEFKVELQKPDVSSALWWWFSLIHTLTTKINPLVF